MKALIISAIFCLGLFQVHLTGQLGHGGIPLPVEPGLNETIPVLDLSQLLPGIYLAEEEAAYANTKALIFAENHDVHITPETDGIWITNSDGYRIWIMGMQSPGAASMGLLFGNYQLEEGARVYIFNRDQSAIIGSLTSENNKISGILPVAHLTGDLIYVQLEMPGDQSGYGSLEISTVSHGFAVDEPENRLKDKYYGLSGDCNIDINCPAGDGFQLVKRSVCRIVINTNKRCTGSLVNNTSQDGKPYVLTAAHCIGSQTEASSAVFLFNYESPVCNGPDGPDKDMISGSTLLSTGDTLGENSNRDSIDFSLVELSINPPDSFHVYYAGWNRKSTPAGYTSSIHHPKGDVKKIAFDHDPPESSYHSEDYYPEYILYSHWRILEWDAGTTEFGSSGGALFDPQQHIIGSLTGGMAYCDDPVNDYFTKFDYSWNYYDDPLRSLKTWLDPINTGVMTLDGAEIQTRVPDIKQYQMQVYPNPGTGIYIVQVPRETMGNFLLEIYDLTGKRVFQNHYHNADRISVDITGQAPGIYILYGRNSDQVYIRKIMHHPSR